MSELAATVAGSLTMAAVLLLAAAARRPSPRRAAATTAAPAPARPSRRRVLGATAAALLATTLVLGPAVALAVSAVAAVVALQRRRTLHTRRRRQLDAAMVDAVELFVVCVHAGRSPTQAVADVGARAPPCLRAAFDSVELQLHRGRSLADALAALRSTAGPTGSELAAAVAAADRDGLPLAPILDRLAAEARAARRRAGEAAARQLPVRMTFPLVLCTLPSFVLLAIAPAVLGAVSTLRAGSP